MTRALSMGLLMASIACSKSSETSQAQGGTKPLTVAEGIDRGNGTDYFSFESGSAWFADSTRPIRYCVEVDGSFGVSKLDAQQAVAASLMNWEQYARAREGKYFPINISFRGILQADCLTADLRFYFGVANSEVQTGIGTTSQKLAGAVKTSYDIRSRWGRGFIWIASHGTVSPGTMDKGDDPVFPNWNAPFTLNAIVLHELGHVFGVGHIDGTIMDENLAYWILHHSKFSRKLQGIDGDRQLLTAIEPTIGELGLAASEAANFELLTGKAPSGPVVAEYGPSDVDPRGGMLTVKDSVGRHEFKIESFSADERDMGFGRSNSVFQILNEDAVGKSTGAFNIHSSSVWYAKIKSANGEDLLITVEENLNTLVTKTTAPYHSSYTATGTVIKLITKSGPKILFLTSIH